MSKPEISVIVPVYKAEKYLHRCIDSILEQTFTDFELILVDDGSPDMSGEICDEYARRDARIRVIHQPNQGQAAARNHAIEHAHGDWICFVDSDDLIHPQMLEHLFHAAVTNDVQISMCGAIESDEIPSDFFTPKDTSFSIARMDEDGMLDLYENGEHRYWIVCAKLIRKEIVKNIPFTADRFYEDNAVVCRWLHEAKQVANTKTAFYFYTINPNGTTKGGFDLKKTDFLWALDQQLCFYKSIGSTKLYKYVADTYFLCAPIYYRKVKKELANHKAANSIKRNLRRVYNDNKKCILLSHSQRLEVLGVISPITARVYNVMYIIKHNGIKGLLQKVLNKIRSIK